MPTCKSQKRAETDKKIKKALDELSTGQFQSIHKAARTNNIAHTTLLRRMNGGKSTAESHEPQQILTIPEENALAECITHLAIVGHPLKHAFICKLAEEIRSLCLQAQNGHASQSSIGNSWVQRFIHQHSKLETVCSHAIEAARIKDITKEDLNRWFDEFERLSKRSELKTCTIWMRQDLQLGLFRDHIWLLIKNQRHNIKFSQVNRSE